MHVAAAEADAFPIMYPFFNGFRSIWAGVVESDNFIPDCLALRGRAIIGTAIQPSEFLKFMLDVFRVGAVSFGALWKRWVLVQRDVASQALLLPFVVGVPFDIGGERIRVAGIVV